MVFSHLPLVVSAAFLASNDSLPTGWVTQAQFVADLNKVEGIKDLGVANYLSLTRSNRLYWNDALISEKTLKSYVHDLKAFEPKPRLYFYAEKGSSANAAQALRRYLSPICNPCIEMNAKEWRGKAKLRAYQRRR